MKNQRGSFPMLRPKAAPRLKARVRGISPPKSSEGRPFRDHGPSLGDDVQMSTMGRIVPRR